MAQATQTTRLYEAFEDRFAGSAALYEQSRQSLAGGIAHDGRYIKPFPLYVDHALGPYKWDVEGHKLIDYAMGHGALILGHNDPDVVAAVHAQLDRGTHFGAGHRAEIAWAEQVCNLIPCADLVRFTASGTEATLLAMRLARAYTGRSSVLKFEGHFHGWNDYLIKGEKPPFEGSGSVGVPDAVSRTVAVVPSSDIGAMEERLSQGDIAAILLEPSGASWASIPMKLEVIQAARDLADKYGSVLIFDEVITGFRWAPGGAQQRYSVTPDLTTLAKIVAGGLPGGAVCGRAEIMEHLIFKDDPVWNSTKKVIHPGTYNANPLAAIAGATCLQKCENPAVQQQCDDMAARLRIGFNTVLEDEGVPGAAWGEASVFHVVVGQTVTNRTAGDLNSPGGLTPEEMKASGRAGLAIPLSVAMQLEGVDLFNTGGLLSVTHTADDIDFTIEAFRRAIGRLRLDELVA